MLLLGFEEHCNQFRHSLENIDLENSNEYLEQARVQYTCIDFELVSVGFELHKQKGLSLCIHDCGLAQSVK